jgi:acyl-CoA reductase-like NAD-dependent aldehyde dehydrogenase
MYLATVCISVLAAALLLESSWECGTTKEVFNVLRQNGEEAVATGLVDDRFYMSFWTSPDSAWSLVVTSTKTVEASCIVISGKNHKKLKSSMVI